MRLPFWAFVVALLAVNLTVSMWPGLPAHGYGHLWLLLPAYFWFRRPRQRRRMLLFTAGIVLQTLAFPEIDLGFLGWFLLWPYLAARECDDGASWWRAAFLYGFLHAHAGYYWLGSIHFLAWFGVSLETSLLFVLGFECVQRWARFLPYALRVATGWILFEWLHSWFLGGFPWLHLSHTQYAYLPVIQAADVVGAAGLTFVMAYVSAAAFRRRRSREAFVAAGFLIALLAYGVLRRGPEAGAADRPRVLMVQSAVSFSTKESGAAGDEIWRRLVRLTEDGLAEDPDVDLIVWPETLHPIPYVEDMAPERSLFLDSLRRNAARFARPMIYGVNSYSTMGRLRQRRGHNSALIADARGVPGELYRKQRLVPMGEDFMPRHVFSEEICARWKRWLEKNLGYPSSSDLEAGDRYVVLDAGPGLRCAPLICFEGLYAHMARAAVKADRPDLILHLVNNGWFGDSWEQRQSVASWVLRAVETRTPFLSCANAGITCGIGPGGRILDRIDRVAEEGFLHVDVPARWPDPVFLEGGEIILPMGVGAACAVFLLFAWRQRRKRDSQ